MERFGDERRDQQNGLNEVMLFISSNRQPPMELLEKIGFPKNYMPSMPELLGRSAELGNMFRDAAHFYDKAMHEYYESGQLVKAFALKPKIEEMYNSGYTSEERDILSKRADHKTFIECNKLIDMLNNDMQSSAQYKEAYNALCFSGEKSIPEEIVARRGEAAGDYMFASIWYNVAAILALRVEKDIQRSRSLNLKATELFEFSISPKMLTPCYYDEKEVSSKIRKAKAEIERAALKEGRRGQADM